MRRKGLLLFLSVCMICGSAGQVYAAPSIENTETDSKEVIMETVEISRWNALADQDELFSGYVDKELGVSLFSEEEPTEDRGMGNKRLAGDQLILYRSMKKEIAQVADGQCESTICDVPEQIDLTMSLEELGIEGVTKITEEVEDIVADAVAKRLDIDNIVKYLLVDCPYDLYWFDKTLTIPMSYTINLYEKTISATDFKLCLYPVEEYAGEEDFTVDIEKTGAARNAAAKAKSIVSEASSLSDYEKIKYYKEQICDMTSYNDEAVEEGNEDYYGNPWQLIWVFDDDEDTEVVCEGYSKAFEYLCELSDFQYDVSARIVSGDMIANDKKPEPHMWNVVTMKDAKNYLVDVTNCDTNTIGAPDKLFLAGIDGNLEDGYHFVFDEYNEALYQYADHVKDTYDSGLLELADHYYDDSVKPYCAHKNVELKNHVDPTCVAEGYTGDKICSKCGETVEEGEIISATGKHTWDAGKQTKAPSCTEKGEMTYTCTVCSETKTEDIPILKPEIIKVNKITIKGLSKQIAAGKKVQLTATVAPENAENQEILWTSSNPKIATVSAKGLVTVKAKTGGKSVTIMATALDGSKVKGLYVIKSMKSAVTKITGKNPKALKVGKTVKLSAKVTAKSGANKKLKWTSGNPKYATVAANGKVKALAPGKGKTVKITAMATDGSGKKKIFTVKIK